MPKTSARHAAPPDIPPRTQTQILWDSLADFDAARVDAALDYLMQGLCALVDARNAVWSGLARLGDAEGDPASGWRPRSVRFLHSTEKLLASVRAQTERMDQHFANDVIAAIATQAGLFRAHRLCDVVPQEWFASDAYRTHYEGCDRADAIYVVFPVNADTESWFGIFRAHGQPPFTAQERDTVAYALRGIKWFHRQLLLSHGLLVAGTPLTDAERSVLQSLLSGKTEKQIAAELGQSPNTTHGHVTALYRKFGVSNRPALMALWLGQGV
ncbi:MAG: LuxR C-terminal-related transcriptional regulator [Sulfuritalea sp.]|nr:LuxR C-terminal-related transcriptional regulator [Sulfuritalea sp.]MDP1982374.1 LuxR C-terminal-related transcriptional regulator [Sulfuritalea sp.]